VSAPGARKLALGLVLLYEDRDLLAVDKPAGLLSIASGGEKEKTCYWILSGYLRGKGGGPRRPAVVHRLDRDTSGVMIFAKSEQIKKTLMDNWDDMVTGRRYIAVAEGDPGGGGEGLIDAPLGEDKNGRVTVRQDGKPARTRWKLLSAGSGYVLLSLELETGRRNQIRAHLAWLGHPVAGDRKYGARTDPLKRLCLHAEKITVHHPRSGRLMEFESPAPEGFARVISRSRSSCT
jgi:23S rRNA pseudouridine1911/1915/1917 synthase